MGEASKEWRSAYGKKRYRDLIAKGLCANCKKPSDGCVKCPDCRAAHKPSRLRYNQRLKDRVFQKYGGYLCVCCGETEPKFLALDHINGGGTKHRQQLGNGKTPVYGHRFYAWLEKNNFPLGFQVLCHNCNWAKSHGGCPHKAIHQSDAR